MPPVLIAFFILQGLAHGPNLINSTILHPYKDPAVHSRGMGKTPIRYNVWTAPRWGGVADKTTKHCMIRFFATVTGGEHTRLNVDGVEQSVDNSWAFDRTTKVNTRLALHFWFIDPVSKETVGYMVRDFKCASEYMPELEHHWQPRRRR